MNIKQLISFYKFHRTVGASTSYVDTSYYTQISIPVKHNYYNSSTSSKPEYASSGADAFVIFGYIFILAIIGGAIIWLLNYLGIDLSWLTS